MFPLVMLSRGFFPAALLAFFLAPSISCPLDAPDGRDGWQRPEEVMDVLGAKSGSRVADIGSGRGYFTFKLADRVGPEGRVYSVEIDRKDLKALERKKQRDGTLQVEVVEGADDDPRLPEGEIDGILVVNAYHEFRRHAAMMSKMAAALRPGGRLVIIDEEAEDGRKREFYHRNHAISAQVVQSDAAAFGLTFLESRPAFRNPNQKVPWFFLVFQKP